MNTENDSGVQGGLMPIVGSAQARMRTNLALHQLLAACKASSRLTKIEEDNAGQPLGGFWDDILYEALSVALLTVASLEAYANELYFENAALSGTVPPAATSLIAELVERESILNKYDLAMGLSCRARLNRGANYVQNVDALIKLRNEVVHFHPQWDGPDSKHAHFSKKLNARFSPSPFLRDEELFPRAWASASFASWALKSTKQFMDRFCEESGIQNPTTLFATHLQVASGGILR